MRFQYTRKQFLIDPNTFLQSYVQYVPCENSMRTQRHQKWALISTPIFCSWASLRDASQDALDVEQPAAVEVGPDDDDFPEPFARIARGAVGPGLQRAAGHVYINNKLNITPGLL